MTLEKLKKYCLQYLEQADDIDVMNEDIETLKENDIFAEYLKNIDHSILMGLVRYATSLILPLCEKEITQNPFYLTEDGTMSGRPLYHKIKEIYAIDEEGNMLPNVKYVVVGKKIFIKPKYYYDVDSSSEARNASNALDLSLGEINKTEKNYTYYVLYYPAIYELDNYVGADKTQGVTDINDLDLALDLNGFGLNIPDDMAINIKYLVYSDMKLEESASLANINKNYFESYLNEMQTNQVQNNQVEIITRDWGDMYGDGNE